MNRDQLEEAAEQRWFEVMLDEVRADRRGATAAPPRAMPWLAAAILLLGLAAVVGVFVSTRTGNSQAAPQEPRPLPAPVPVRGSEALQALDPRTENVLLQFDAAEGLPPFDHLPYLRALSLESDPGAPPSSPAPSLQPLAACPRLEQVAIRRFGGSCGAAALRPLMELPNLRSLTLVGCDKRLTVDVVEVLSKLALRSLSLQDAELHPAGFAALDGLPLLQRIELRHCGGLGKCDLRVLCRLRELRGLSLRDQAFPEVLRFAVTTGQMVTITICRLPATARSSPPSTHDGCQVSPKR
ncbi:MAG: hypothetical protein H6838_10885 [Planctomycetes bacterium]|nr:hypothetical protein [Planctomycetota bacterium]